ncbi:hypothetical protein DFJ73DRAFT_959427 [Zopfochytrium polystomum]|nr:hypothetical protein DFJ73DRAFT_959427 [Zopfochytrium polystomum]
MVIVQVATAAATKSCRSIGSRPNHRDHDEYDNRDYHDTAAAAATTAIRATIPTPAAAAGAAGLAAYLAHIRVGAGACRAVRAAVWIDPGVAVPIWAAVARIACSATPEGLQRNMLRLAKQLLFINSPPAVAIVHHMKSKDMWRDVVTFDPIHASAQVIIPMAATPTKVDSLKEPAGLNWAPLAGQAHESDSAAFLAASVGDAEFVHAAELAYVDQFACWDGRRGDPSSSPTGCQVVHAGLSACPCAQGENASSSLQTDDVVAGPIGAPVATLIGIIRSHPHFVSIRIESV